MSSSQPPSKRPRLRPSEDERRLVPTYENRPEARPITMPGLLPDMQPQRKRKFLQGGPRPMNTLSVEKSTGDNVNKKRRIDSLQRYGDGLVADGQPELVSSSSFPPFDCAESRRVDSLTSYPTDKKARITPARPVSPKINARTVIEDSSIHVTPREEPGVVDDDDEPENAVRRVPERRLNLQPRQAPRSATYSHAAFRRISPEPADRRVSAGNNVGPATNMSSRINDTFIPPIRHGSSASAKVADRQSPPVSMRTRPVAVRDDDSEDELANGSHMVTSKRARRVTSPSPTDINSTCFGSPKIRLKSAQNLISHLHSPLRATYSPSQRCCTITGPRDPQHGDESETFLKIEIKHTHVAYFAGEGDSSNVVVLSGANDKTTGGRIILDFASRACRDELLRDLGKMHRSMSSRPCTDQQLERVCQNAKQLWTQQIQAAQSEPSYAVITREQASPRVAPTALQTRRRLSLGGGTLKARMSSNFVGQGMRLDGKAASPPSSPPATSELPRAASPLATSDALITEPSRSSKRLRLRTQSGAAIAQSPPPQSGWTTVHGIPQWKIPLTWPLTGARRTTVEAADIQRLDDGEFLNDNIILFSLRRLQEKHPELESTVYVFNTFFYSAMSTKGGRKAFNYDAVRRWTKNVDIFSHPYVVVPINVNLHWFVVIICNLDKLGKERESPAVVVPDSTAEENMVEDEKMTSVFDNMSIDSETEDPMVASQTTLDQMIKPTRKGKKRLPPPPAKLDPDQPSILTLDSLGSSHAGETRMLKDYIVAEAADKKQLTVDSKDLKGMVARGIPEQTNFCDCGVYLVGYVAEFFKNPRAFVQKAHSRELDRNNDFAGFDPAEERAAIRRDLIELEKVQAEARVQAARKKRAKKEAEKGVAQSDDDVAPSSSAPVADEGGERAEGL